MAVQESRNSNLTKVEKLDEKLRILDIGYNQIETLDYSLIERVKFWTKLESFLPTGLTKLIVCHNSLTTLDVSMCAGLVHLDCSHNDLESLPIIGEKNKVIQYLNVAHNKITYRRKLIGKEMFPNSLTYLNISFNPDLEEVRLGPNSSVEALICTNLKLIDLVIPKNAWYVECSYNQIRKLDIKGTQLKILKSSNNKLTEVTVNSEMTELDVSHNYIKKLEGVALVQTLNANNNQLTKLSTNASIVNISRNLFKILPDIGLDAVEIDISHNYLTRLNTTEYTKLEKLNCSNNQISILYSNARYVDAHSNRLGWKFKIDVRLDLPKEEKRKFKADPPMYNINLQTGSETEVQSDSDTDVEDDFEPKPNDEGFESSDNTDGRYALPNVEKLNISDNGLIQFRCNSKLKVLDCSHNSLIMILFSTQPLNIAMRKYHTDPAVSSSCPDSFNSYCVNAQNEVQVNRTMIKTIKPGLEYVNCSHNKLNEIPKELLECELKYMDFSYNNLTGMPNISDLPLEYIDISHNNIVQLYSVPKLCHTLYCHYNNIFTFESLHLVGCNSFRRSRSASERCKCLDKIVRFKYERNLDK